MFLFSGEIDLLALISSAAAVVFSREYSLLAVDIYSLYHAVYCIKLGDNLLVAYSILIISLFVQPMPVRRE